MKKTFFTLLLTFLLQTCCCADSSIKFVQVTDVHFKADNQYSIDRVDKTVKDINNLKDVSFVVFTGDNIDHPIEKDLAIFIKKINKLKVPYYLVLGNHDVSKGQGLSKEKYNKVVRENNYLWFHLKWNYVFKKKGYTFIVLDGAKEVIPGPNGYYKEETLKWLDNQLAKNADKPVIIFQHYPVIDSKDFSASRYKTHKVYQVEKYYDVINKYDNILAIVSGHLHVNSETMENGIYHINTPPLISEPTRYKIIDIVTKKGLSPIIYTQIKEVDIQ